MLLEFFRSKNLHFIEICRMNPFCYPDLVNIVIKSQSRIIQYHLEFEVEPEVQSHSGCSLKLGVA